MKYQIFKNQIIEKTKEHFHGEINISIREVTKNNGIVLTGLTFSKKNINISPTIYLDCFYEEYCRGKNIDEIVEEITMIYEQSKMKENLDMEFFTNYDKAKNNIVYKLINYEKNKGMLEDVPHRRFLDLAVVYYYVVEREEFSRATILIRNNHLDIWKVSPDEIYGVASVNTPRLLKYTVSGMLEVLSEWEEDVLCRCKNRRRRCYGKECGSPDDYMKNCVRKDETGMYVLSNTERLNGAVSILYSGVLEAFAKKLGKDFYILPSSIHEVILIPDENNIEKRKLEEMVHEVNMTQLEPEEYLSDTVYYYSTKCKKVVSL